ncbi:MAG: demethylmenaquinone methyltransferase [Mycobacterium sp.]|nr:demethylmenaquinone methyltransferase [Mycobacterium sp.]
MAVTLGRRPAPVAPDLVDRLRALAYPTIGHYLEEGFLDTGIHRLAGQGKVAGRAITVRTTPTDSSNLHHVASDLEPGDVLLVDTGGDRRHAPLGEVVTEAIHARGAAAVIVDGVCTDIDELRRIGLPVYARGTSLLTTKLEDTGVGSIYRPIVCGGQHVQTGDIVLADENGVLVASAETLERIVKTVEVDDEEEPALIDAIRAGARLGDLTGATSNIQRHSVFRSDSGQDH